MCLDTQFMAQALALAKRGIFTCRPNPAVGCVLVKDGVVVGQGFHATAGSAHAEINALKEAGDNAQGATAYVTLEPCSHQGKTPPCVDALIQAQVVRVVTALQDPNPKVNGAGIKALKAAGIKVTTGVMADEAAELNLGFCHHMQMGKPYVRLKMAVSLDGKIATAAGESQWITGETARADVQQLRAQSGAVITGVGTVLSDNPRLNVRLENALQPLRVVMSRGTRMPHDAQLLSLPGDTWVEPGSPEAVLQKLSGHNIHSVLIESGPMLAGAFLDAGLVDELWWYIAPKIIGDAGQSAVTLCIDTLAEAKGFALVSHDKIGDDVRLILRK
jgi:diaminohydroxyphosphoribosylaminopyrimidine deaminase/5-amino-6-(5-phosphoribosylamino)uracil reductase